MFTGDADGLHPVSRVDATAKLTLGSSSSCSSGSVILFCCGKKPTSHLRGGAASGVHCRAQPLQDEPRRTPAVPLAGKGC